jgi:hypothetical protein
MLRRVTARPLRQLTIALSLAASALLAVASVASAMPAVFATGTFATPASYLMDLDNGAVTTTEDKADAWYQIDATGHRLLTPVRADVVLFGSNQPTFKQCKNAMAGGASWDMNQYLGKWFCAHTNKGRVNRFKVVKATDVKLTLKFTTWS